MRWLLVVACASASVAYASPAAEKLFQDGRSLLKDGKLPEACEAFRKSQELEPRVGTLLNLADCEERRGRVATAWEAFVQARALATQNSDPRASEAEKRAQVLAPKLPYLTVRSPAVKPSGLTVKRDGKDVTAELDREVPVDPGRYELEVTAPRHVTWTGPATVVIGEKSSVQIPALAVDPSAPVETPGGPTTSSPPIVPLQADIVPPAKLTGKHRIGAGAAIGLSSDSDVIYGVRIPVQVAPVGRGAIRALPSLFYAKFDDPADVYHEIKLYALGLGVEYVHPFAPTFFVAGGAGVGMDIIDDNYGNENVNQMWGAARLSPTVKIAGVIDIGLHFQLVRTKDRTVGLGELGVDYFFW